MTGSPTPRPRRCRCALLFTLTLLACCIECQGFFGGGKRAPVDSTATKGRKVVFIFSKARSATSITSKLFDRNSDFIHFHEPFSSWRNRRADERSLHSNVDFLERLVSCQLTSEEVYNVVTQGMVVPEQLRQQRMPSMQAAREIPSLCNGRHVAIKTIRMNSLQAICQLQKRIESRGDEVYVIDTYRDPRAVVASLIDSGHEALSSIPLPQKVKKLSESACQHMTARFKADDRECRGLRKYSLQNEHFARDPLHEGQRLYKFLKLKMPAEVGTDLEGGVQLAGVAEREGVEANGKAASTEGGAELQTGEAKPPASKQWYDVLSRTQGTEVERVCKRLMPRDLYRMVFVAE